jgi:hypothetical protein
MTWVSKNRERARSFICDRLGRPSLNPQARERIQAALKMETGV